MPETCEVIVKDEGFHVKAVKIQFLREILHHRKAATCELFKKNCVSLFAEA